MLTCTFADSPFRACNSIGMDGSGSREPQSGKATAHVTLKQNQMILIEAILSYTHHKM